MDGMENQGGISPDIVPSPCVSVCRIDSKSGWCEGCKRSLQEIRTWSKMTNEQKGALLAELEGRVIPKRFRLF